MIRPMNLHGLPLILFAATLLLIQTGCTRSEQGTGVDTDWEEPPAVQGQTEDLSNEADSLVYDLETETGEVEDTDTPEEIEELIEPLETDTIQVEEVAVKEAAGYGYGLGFRIQVFASGELEKAKLFKEKAQSETGLPAYIDFEGGLYKVRIGDFGSRDEAATARTRLTDLYPDCWIVKTTIRK
jgi:hypothetical protein